MNFTEASEASGGSCGEMILVKKQNDSPGYLFQRRRVQSTRAASEPPLRVQNLGFRVSGSGFWISGFGFRV